jgi:hypothetical protein
VKSVASRGRRNRHRTGCCPPGASSGPASATAGGAAPQRCRRRSRRPAAAPARPGPRAASARLASARRRPGAGLPAGRPAAPRAAWPDGTPVGWVESAAPAGRAEPSEQPTAPDLGEPGPDRGAARTGAGPGRCRHPSLGRDPTDRWARPGEEPSRPPGRRYRSATAQRTVSRWGPPGEPCQGGGHGPRLARRPHRSHQPWTPATCGPPGLPPWRTAISRTRRDLAAWSVLACW